MCHRTAVSGRESSATTSTTFRRDANHLLLMRAAASPVPDASSKCALLFVLLVSASASLGAPQQSSGTSSTTSALREHVCDGNHTSNAMPKSKSPRSTPGADTFYIFKRSVRIAFDKLGEKDAQFVQLYDIADIADIATTASNYGGRFLEALQAAKHYRRLYRLACILEDFLSEYMLVTVDTRDRPLDRATKQRASIFCEHTARLNSIKHELVQIIKSCSANELKTHFKHDLFDALSPYAHLASETYKQRTDYTLHYIYSKLIRALQVKVKRRKVCRGAKARGARKDVENARARRTRKNRERKTTTTTERTMRKRIADKRRKRKGVRKAHANRSRSQ